MRVSVNVPLNWVEMVMLPPAYTNENHTSLIWVAPPQVGFAASDTELALLKVAKPALMVKGIAEVQSSLAGACAHDRVDKSKAQIIVERNFIGLRSITKIA